MRRVVGKVGMLITAVVAAFDGAAFVATGEPLFAVAFGCAVAAFVLFAVSLRMLRRRT